MTSEHRLLFTLQDISAVRWQCGTCQTAVSFQLDQAVHLPETCATCHERLLDLQGREDHRRLREFVDLLRVARQVHTNGLSATLTLEYVQP